MTFTDFTPIGNSHFGSLLICMKFLTLLHCWPQPHCFKKRRYRNEWITSKCFIAKNCYDCESPHLSGVNEEPVMCFTIMSSVRGRQLKEYQRQRKSLVVKHKIQFILVVLSLFWELAWGVDSPPPHPSDKELKKKNTKIQKSEKARGKGRSEKEWGTNSVSGRAPRGAVHIPLPCSVFHDNKVRWTAEVSLSSCFLGWKFQALRTICLYVHWCIWEPSIRLQLCSCWLVRPAAFL